jgi:hypothetical protein
MIMPSIIVLGNARYEALHGMIRHLQSTLLVCHAEFGGPAAQSPVYSKLYYDNRFE